MIGSDIHAVLFDMDGVLADTREPLLSAWGEVLSKHDLYHCFEIIEDLLVGVIDYRSLHEALARETGSKGAAESIVKEAEVLYRSRLPEEVRAIPGLHGFLRELDRSGTRKAVVTSASRETMEVALGALELLGSFDCLLSSDEVRDRKPDPEVFARAAKLLNVEPAHCLVLEDAPEGIAAAKALGMPCVALSTTYETGTLVEADAVIRSFEEFPWRLFRFRTAEGDDAGVAARQRSCGRQGGR